MPLQLVAFDDSPSCRGWTWAVSDPAALATVVAHLLLGQYLHAESVLKGTKVKPPPMLSAAYLSVLRQLTQPADVSHRDGWLFQMISWVAAKQSDPSLLSRAPQPRAADKGFDGLFVQPIKGSNGSFYVIVCEDKATSQPRRVIRNDVWPGIRELERGKRDHEILSDLTTVLAATMATHEAQAAVTAITWKNVRRYRVSVTVGQSRTQEHRRRALFKGYRQVARGKSVRRRGEMLVVDDLRSWMNRFARDVAREVRRLRSNGV